jgi:hypothetical protein
MPGSRRDNFLLRMYGEYWDNISRAEDNAWKIFASYTALFAGLALIHPIIGDFGFLLLILIFSSVAIAIALRANLWYVRNLGLISNLEQEFLEERDYGIIVPHPFLKKPRFINDEIWWIHIITYLLITFSLILLIYQRLEESTLCTLKYSVFICLVVCFFYGCKLYLEYRDFITQAPGKYAKTKSN